MRLKKAYTRSSDLSNILGWGMLMNDLQLEDGRWNWGMRAQLTGKVGKDFCPNCLQPLPVNVDRRGRNDGNRELYAFID